MRKYLIFLAFLSASLASVFCASDVFAAPTGNPPTGGGAIKVNSSAPSGSISVDSTGRVGIGTDTPVSILHLRKDGGGGPAISFTDDNTNTVTGKIANTIATEGKRELIFSTWNGSALVEDIRIITGGFKFSDGTTQTTTAGGNQISAGNVSSGTFGSNTGGGSYGFAADLGTETGTILTLKNSNMARINPGSSIDFVTGVNGNVLARISGIRTNQNNGDEGRIVISAMNGAGTLSPFISTGISGVVFIGSDLASGSNYPNNGLVVANGGSVPSSITGAGHGIAARLKIQSGDNDFIALDQKTIQAGKTDPGGGTRPGDLSINPYGGNVGIGGFVSDVGSRTTLPSGSDFHYSRISGDSFDRLRISGTTANGIVLNWGGGTAATDTNLYRSAANTLRTDDTFVADSGVNFGDAGTGWGDTYINDGGGIDGGGGGSILINSQAGIRFAANSGNSAPHSIFEMPVKFQPDGVFSKPVVNIIADGSYSNPARTALRVEGSNANPIVDVYSGSTNVFRIASNGNVGIGTTNPVGALQVNGTSNHVTQAYNIDVHDTTSMAANVGGSIEFSGNDIAAGQRQGFALIKAHKDNSTEGNYAAGLAFYTRAAGSSSWVEKTGAQMFIASNGNVGIGTTDPSAAKLVVAGTVKIIDGSQGANKVLTSDANGLASWTTPASSGVTSVGLSLPSIFTVSNSPVTSTGTLTGTLATQTANLFFASPNGATGAPTFRSIVGADIPTLNQNTTGTAANVTGTVAVGNGGTGTSTGSITGTGALTFTAGGTNTNVTLVPSGTGSVNVSSKTITNLAAPVNSSDAATKAYVDAASGSGPNYETGAKTSFAGAIDSFGWTTAVNINGAGYLAQAGASSLANKAVSVRVTIDGSALSEFRVSPGERSSDSFIGPYRFGTSLKVEYRSPLPKTTLNNYSSYNGHWYRGVAGDQFDSADQSCRNEGGHLATITSLGENTFLKDNFMTSGNSYWVGTTDASVEGTWEHITGESLSYTNWAVNEPNNSGNEDCVMVSGSNGQWNDGQCHNSQPYICEYGVAGNYYGWYLLD